MNTTFDECVARARAEVPLYKRNTPNNAVPDGPVTGNGDIGLSLDADEQRLRIWIGKNDLWLSLPNVRGGGMKALGYIDILSPGAIYTAYENLQTGSIELTASSSDGGAHSLMVYAPRGESAVVIEALGERGKTRVALDADALRGDPHARIEREADASRIRFSKGFDAGEWPVRAELELCGEGALDIALEAGERQAFIANIKTQYDEDMKPLTHERLCEARRAHEAWWKAFWARSGVHIEGEPEIERYWYGSNYILACCCDARKFAPGIFGNFLTSDAPNWGGDYHLNYNHEAPFWGLFSSNQLDIARAYERPVLEYVPRAQKNAREQLGTRGLYSKVGIGPKGQECSAMFYEDGTPNEVTPYWGQKTNASYAALNFLMMYDYTRDLAYARNAAYPYLCEVLAFWEDYLVLEGDRYVIVNDCIHENPGAMGKTPDYSDDFNSLVSLALVRASLKGAIDMSRALGVDAEKRETWADILAHLSAFPTQVRGGREMYRYTERGMDWCDSNSLGIQHIYPAGAINLGSDARERTLSTNMLVEMARWEDYNAFPTFFTAAARIGYDPKVIFTKMNEQLALHGYPNYFIYYGGGGIECASAVPATVNDMMVQRYDGLLRFFPVWNRALDAEFHDLRLPGAVLASASLAGGEVTKASVTCERACALKVLSPWPHGMEVSCGGQRVPAQREDTWEGAVYAFSAEAGAVYALS